ncbi:MAG: hypothetical protein HQK99_05275 [Nitrospirae bacterium]|nr:hypothetical protein [Nitrospirota bacterium]
MKILLCSLLILAVTAFAYIPGTAAESVTNTDSPVSPLATTGNQTYNGSPFGILGPYEYWSNSPKVISKADINSLMTDLGVKWVDELPFDLPNLTSDMNAYTRVGSTSGITPPNIDYSRYVPLLNNQISSLKDRVKYYEIDTEPVGGLSPWSGNAVKYAEFLKQSYSIIKSVCSDCYVVLGGLPGAGINVSSNDQNSTFLTTILNDNASKYFDVFEFKQHFHTLKDYRIIKTRKDTYEKILSNYGIDITKIPVFLETAMYSGNPQSSINTLTPQTDNDQAIGVVKTYVYALSIGVNKIFWNDVMELYNFGGNPKDPFNFYGLVNNKNNDGYSFKKLSYYTYKKMVETLEGSDWKNITTVLDSGGVFVCRFTKNGKYTWVVWNDNPTASTVNLTSTSLSPLKVTVSVPNATWGWQISDYSSSFIPTTIAVNGGHFNVVAGKVPFYVEEQ